MNIGLMHILFALEDMYELKIGEIDREICLRLDKSDYSTYSSMFKMFHAWHSETSRLEKGEITREKYGESPAAVLDSLHCRLAVIILPAFGNGINKISADMRPAGAAPDSRQIVIALIAVRFQISAVAFQKLFCMAAAPGRRIAIQDDRRKSILAASEQPHERLDLCSAAFLIQHLDPSLICHCKTAFQQLPVEVIMHRLKIDLRTVEDPAGKGSAADPNPILFPVLLLSVKGKPIGMLLIHRPCSNGC